MHLWDNVDAYDAYIKKRFTFSRALDTITNGFLANANIFCWSTKGHFACPACEKGFNHCGRKMDVTSAICATVDCYRHAFLFDLGKD